MKCRAWILEETKVSKKTGKSRTTRRVIGDDYEREEIDWIAWQRAPKEAAPKTRSKLPAPKRVDEARLCGGDIVATVEVEMEVNPSCGCSGEVVIALKCGSCKHTYHGPDVPKPETLSALVTGLIAEMPNPIRW